MAPRGRSSRNPPAVIAVLGMALLLTVLFALMTYAQNPPGGSPAKLDVKVTNISFSSDKPMEDAIITIEATVYNNGTKDLTDMALTFSYDQTKISSIPNVSIPAKGNTTVHAQWKAVAWSHTITVVASNNNTTIQQSTLTRDISVTAKPVGNALTVVAALLVIIIVILCAVAFPSIMGHIRKRT